MKETTRVLIALGAAFALGVLASLIGNPALLHAVDSVAPVGTLWVNAIRMTVIPLVVSLLITGIASVRDVKSIGRLGGRTLATFIALSAGLAAIAIPLIPLIFTLFPQAGATPQLPAGAQAATGMIAAGGQVQTFGAWLVSLVPSNPVAAAANGEMISLIIFTILLALAIARSPEHARETLVHFFQALGDAMLILVHWVVLAAPIGIFALVLPLVAHSSAAFAGKLGFYVAAYSLSCLAAVLLVYPVVAIVARVPIAAFARAVLPAQLIAFSSSSSIASLPALIESGETLRLPPSVTGFVMPLSVSAFKFAAPVSWTVGAVFIGHFYGVPLHARDLATVAFAAVFLSFAVPGIPRGAFIMLAPLFAAIGLPVEGIGILIAVDAIPDTFATILNVTGDFVAAVLVARREKLVT
jgi:Na+/H+-dicarboxylate symporter